MLLLTRRTSTEAFRVLSLIRIINLRILQLTVQNHELLTKAMVSSDRLKLSEEQLAAMAQEKSTIEHELQTKHVMNVCSTC